MTDPIARIHLELDAKESLIKIELAECHERINRVIRGELAEHLYGQMFPLADELLSARRQRECLRETLREINDARAFIPIPVEGTL